MTRDELEAMTKDELVAYADDRDIEVSHSWVKSDIVSAILKAERAASRADTGNPPLAGGEPAAPFSGNVDQYAPGGAAAGVAADVGVDPATLDQYAPGGGVAGQLAEGAGVPVEELDQYAPGGPVGQVLDASTGGATGTTGTTGATGTS
jgi:hypothetical protein